MADVIGRLVVKLESDASGVDEGIDRAKGKFDGFKSVVQGVALGAGMAVGNFAIQAGQSLLQFGGDSVDAASDLGETVSKVETLFGESSAGIMAWAKGSATSLGLPKQAALDAVGTIGNLFMQLGAGSDEAASVGQGMVQLSADLASFHNVAGGSAQVLDAMTAAFRGEYDALQAYIPTINGAAVEQQALAMTGKATADELTNLDKALATQAIMARDAGAAVGDFARTSDGLANQQRVLDAQWANMQATLGQLLLPVTLAFTQGMNVLLQNVLPPLSAFMTSTLIPAMSGLGETIGGLIGFFMEAAGGGGDLHERLEKLPGPMRGIAQFISGGLLPALQGIVSAIQQAMGPAIEAAMGWFGELGRTVQEQTRGPLNFLQGWIAQNMPRIQQIVESVLGAITSFWETHGARIQAVVQSFMGIVVSLWDTQFRTILNIVQVALQLLTGDFEGAGKTIQNILNDWRIFFESSIRTITNGIRQWFQEVDWGGVGRAIIEGIGNGLRSMGGWLAEQARQAGGNLLDALKQALGINSPSRVAAAEIGVPFAEGIGAGLLRAGGWLAEQARVLALNVADAAAGALGAQPLMLPAVEAATDAPELPDVPELEPLEMVEAEAVGEIAAPDMPVLPALTAPDMPTLPALTAPDMPVLPALAAPDLSAAWAAVGRRLGDAVAGWWAVIGPQAATLAGRLGESLAAVDWRGVGGEMIAEAGAGLVSAGGWLAEQARVLALDVADAAAGALGAAPLMLPAVVAATDAPELPDVPELEPLEMVEAGPVGEIAAPEMPALAALRAPDMPVLPALAAPDMPVLPALAAPDLSAAWAAVGRRLGDAVAGWWAVIGPQAATLAGRLGESLAAVDWRGVGGEMIAEAGAGLVSAGGWLAEQARVLALDVADAAAGALGAQPLMLPAVVAATDAPEMPDVPELEPLEMVEAEAVGEIAAPDMPVLPALTAPDMPVLPALAAPDMPTLPALTAPDMPVLPALAAPDLSAAWAAVGRRLGDAVAGWWAVIGPQAATLAGRLGESLAAVDWRGVGGEMIAEAGAGLVSAGGWLAEQARVLALDVADAAAGALGAQPLMLPAVEAATDAPELPDVPEMPGLEPLEAEVAGEVSAPEMPALAALAAPQMPELPALAAPQMPELPALAAPDLSAAWAAVGRRLGDAVAGWWAVIGPQAATLAGRLGESLAAVDWRGVGGEMIAEAGAGLVSAGGWLAEQARVLALDVADAAAGALGAQPLMLPAVVAATDAPEMPDVPELEPLEPGEAAEQFQFQPDVNEAAEAGWWGALARIQERLEAALIGLADTLEVNTASAPSMAGPVAATRFGPQPGGSISIRLEQNFYGQTEPAVVRVQSREGLLEALRATGAR